MRIWSRISESSGLIEDRRARARLAEHFVAMK